MVLVEVVLVNIESNGVLLDTEALKQSSQHFTVRLQEIEKEIYEMAGETFNISSAKQVGEVLFDKLKIVEKAKKTKTGQYVTSEEVLQSYRSKHDIIGKILEYRGLKKLLMVSKILKSYLAKYDHNDDNSVWFNKLKEIADEHGFASDSSEMQKKHLRRSGDFL